MNVIEEISETDQDMYLHGEVRIERNVYMNYDHISSHVLAEVRVTFTFSRASTATREAYPIMMVTLIETCIGENRVL
jgi:hypothetical protein